VSKRIAMVHPPGKRATAKHPCFREVPLEKRTLVHEKRKGAAQHHDGGCPFGKSRLSEEGRRRARRTEKQFFRKSSNHVCGIHSPRRGCRGNKGGEKGQRGNVQRKVGKMAVSPPKRPALKTTKYAQHKERRRREIEEKKTHRRS